MKPPPRPRVFPGGAGRFLLAFFSAGVSANAVTQNTTPTGRRAPGRPGSSVSAVEVGAVNRLAGGSPDPREPGKLHVDQKMHPHFHPQIWGGNVLQSEKYSNSFFTWF